jgi:hypothetical protein
MPVIIDGTNGITQAGEFNSDSSFGFKNRIINGAMVIDQRNAGASITPTNGQYGLDRWRNGASAASKFSVQQDAGAVTPPVGFTDYLGATSLSTYAVGSGEIFLIQQYIEGYNIADLNWGTANAKTITLSFWVRSSLTGTFGGSLQNSDRSRSYPFTYSISTANTWEYETITIAGDTTGTWLATNGIGVQVNFSLGTGSTLSGTAGAWSSSNFFSATGATSVVGTNGATFYITGVQFEVGSTATSFDYRPYTTELQLCQRYFQVFQSQTGVEFAFFGIAIGYGTTFMRVGVPAQVQMRATPTLGSSAAGTFYLEGGYANSISAITGYGTTNRNLFVWQVTTPTTSSGASWFYAFNTNAAFLTASIEL